MSDIESAEKIAKDIEMERNQKPVVHIQFAEKKKDVYNRTVDYCNDSKYYLKKEDMRTAFDFTASFKLKLFRNNAFKDIFIVCADANNFIVL